MVKRMERLVFDIGDRHKRYVKLKDIEIRVPTDAKNFQFLIGLQGFATRETMIFCINVIQQLRGVTRPFP